MATIYTQEELDNMWRELNENRPEPPGKREWPASEEALSYSAAASSIAMLIRFAMADKREVMFALNPVQATHLGISLGELAQAAGWTDKPKKAIGYVGPTTDRQRKWEKLRKWLVPETPTDKDMAQALKVVSLHGGGSPETVELSFRLSEGSVSMVRLNSVLGAHLLGTIVKTWDQLGWVDQNGLVPRPDAVAN